VGRARSADLEFDVLTRFEIEAVATAPERLGSTLVSLVPTTLARLLDAQAPVERFGAILLGGAPVPPELLERACQRGARVVTTYGLSETWGGVIHDGRPLAGVEIRIADDDEILVRAPQVMRGYRSVGDLSPAPPSPFLADGWFRTGDAGRIDPEGRLAVIDRLSDMVVSGGVNVSPAEVERVLSTHPDVEEVCVSGRPDAEWGERVVAFVVPRDPAAPPTLDELQAVAREELSAPAVPRELVLLYAVPRSPSGKALRRLLPQARD
ncbi:MAG: class I adenylate-forming enzyme family protein, partial [Acidimicrobiia bacterium]